MNPTLGRQDLRQVSHLHRASVRGWSAPRVSRLRSPTLAASLVLGVVTLVLRLSYAASGPTDTSGAQDAIGSGRFDVTHAAPPAPGSWLYVAAGHAVHLLTGLGTVGALVLVAAVLSAGAAALTCLAGTSLGGPFVGAASGVLVATAPVSWFAGATISPSSVDAFVAALLMVLARRARRSRAHGIVAVIAIGLGAGLSLSVLPAFALLGAIAVVASIRTVGHLLATMAAAVASVAVWFVPMILIQPGGLASWLHALRVQISDSAHASSVFVAPASSALTNVGTFGGWSVVTLSPVVVMAVLGVVALAGARVATRRPGGDASLRIWSGGGDADDRVERPWYQGTGAIVGAAVIPPVALLTLGQFPGGGAVLFYLVPVTVLLLLPVGRILRHRNRALRRGAAVVATLLVALAVSANVQRFVAAPGILPATVARHHGLWLSQARYQAPYAATADAIRTADRTDDAVHRLRSVVHRATDVVVCVAPDDSSALYRTIDFELPDVVVALVHPFRSLAFGGLLYRHHPPTLDVGTGGHAVVLTTSPSPTLTALAALGLATETTTHVGRFAVWRVAPGASLFGVTVTAVAGPRPL